MIGIYKIKNTLLNREYIGSSIYPKERLSGHKTKLLKGTHICKVLQEDWNNQKPEDFVFEVVKWIDCNVISKDLRSMEYDLIGREKPYYNTHGLPKKYRRLTSLLVPRETNL